MTLKDMIPFGKKSVPVRKDEGHPFALFRREMDDLFDSFFRDFDFGTHGLRTEGFVPNVDLSENEKEVRVTAELPGMDEKDIEVSLSRDALTIRGEKQEESEDSGQGYYHMERSFGSFSRSIPVPPGIDAEKVAAKFNKGVLTILIPKAGKAVTDRQKIQVRTE